MENTTGKIDVAKDAAVKAQLMSIKTGVQAYIATNGSVPQDASQATLGGFVSPWPTNPFSKRADEARHGRGRLRLHARRRHRVHPGGEPLRRQHVQRP